MKTSGLRWISMMLLTPIPWAQRVWALPFFSVLAPSERYNQQHRRRHKKLTDWGRQMIQQLRRWLPGRMLVVVADSTWRERAKALSIRHALMLQTHIHLMVAPV